MSFDIRKKKTKVKAFIFNFQAGSTCTNNEDFGNGTVFGTFICPLPEFDPSARYCCGESEYEYCCRFFDE